MDTDEPQTPPQPATDPDTATLMHQMGFSEFGSTAPSARHYVKKRKFNHGSSDTAGGSRMAATIESQEPPHVPAVATKTRPISNPGEGRADNDDNDNDNDANDNDNDDDGEEDGGALLGTQTTQVAHGHPSLPPRPSPAADDFRNQRGRFRGQGAHRGRGGYRGRGYGNADGPWWEDYYDFQSNQNPWAKLERRLGLEPVGEWPTVSGQ